MYSLSTGDRIKHRLSGNEYTVISINLPADTFLAKRDGDGQQIDFARAHFDKIFEIIGVELPIGMGNLSDWLEDTKLNPKCECGVDTLGHGNHSNYCPKKETNNV